MAKRNNIKPRRGFTLVELLVVVLIITILASITLFALFNAGEAAKKARTRAQIAKIHELLMPVWEQYVTRRAPVPVPISDQNQAAQLRVDIIRELMRMELPDRKSDVEDDVCSANTTKGLNRPSLSRAYLRKAQGIPGGIAAWTTTHQGAECLYLILGQLRDGDSTGLEFFQEVEFGDVDGDGMKEIIDGWGKPIAFLRWAPGWLDPYSALQKTSVADPVDPNGTRGNPPTTYALFPLIFSAGPDTAYDIAVDGAAVLHYNATTPPNNPYTTIPTPKLGSPVTATATGWQDNIHSHMSDISIR